MASQKVEYVISIKDLVTPGLKNAAQSVGKFEAKLTGLKNPLGGLMGMIGKIGAAFAVFETVKSVVKLGSDLEVTRVKFATFLGSVEAADKHIRDLQKLGAETPFEFGDLEKSSSLLQNFGVKADQLIPTIRTLGDLSAGSAEKLDSITLAYGKIKTKGKATMEELNMLIEGGQIPIMAELAKVTGKSGAELSKFISDGKVGIGTVQQAFKNLTSEGGMFNNMMAKQSQTLAGRWSTLIDTIKNVGTGIGTSLLEPLGKIVDYVSYFVSFVTDNFATLKRIFAPIRQAVQPLIDAFKQVAEKIGLTGEKGEILENIFNAIGNAITFLAPIIGTIADVLGTLYTTIADIVMVIYNWIKNNEWVQKSLMALYTAGLRVFQALGNAAKNIFGGIGDLIAGAFTLDGTKVANGLKKLGSALIEANPINLAIQGGKGLAEGYEKGFTGTDFFKGRKDKAAEGLEKQDFLVEENGSGGSSSKDKSKKGLGSGVGSVHGDRSTANYNITINKLVETLELNTTNLSDSSLKVKEELTKALLAAVNDFQKFKVA